MHSILLFVEGIVTNLLVKCHQDVSHGGKGYTLNKLRHLRIGLYRQIHWFNFFVARFVRSQYLRGKLGKQKIPDLSADINSAEPLFTHIGLGMFALFMAK